MSYETGSLINEIYSGMQSADVEIGMGATVLSFTDRHAATVVSISSNGRRIGIKYDKAIRTDDNGTSDSQSYRYEPGEGPTLYFTKRKDGRFVKEGETLSGGQKVLVGTRDHYHDFSF